MRFSICLRDLTRRVFGLALCLWGLGALTGPRSEAQITVPRPGEDLNLRGPSYLVPQDLGETHGQNLFHRFLEFNVDTDESVTFTGGDVTNIISLITGEHASHIDGTIRSDIEGANLFLLNPNGVMFGANAQLDVKGSFHVSTADGVRFADGTIYTGDLRDEDRLIVASPVAFGFMRESPSRMNPLVIEGSLLRVPTGERLSVVGGDITMAGGSLSAAGGSLNLIGVGTAFQGDVPLDTNAPSPVLTGDFENFGEDFGTIKLSGGAALSTDGNSGGQIVIRSGQLTIDQSAITSSNDGMMDSPGVGIDIQVTGTVRLLNRSEVTSGVARLGRGRGGDIRVKANEIFIAEGASITTSGVGPGRAGDVWVHAETSVTIQDPGGDGPSTGIFSFAGFASQAGLIEVRGGSLVMDGGVIGASPDANIGRRSPRSGGVTVEVDRLRLSDGARIDSRTSGDFPGGTVNVTVKEAALLTDRSVITVGTAGAANAGDINIAVRQIILQGGSEIASESNGLGAAGTITITTSEITLSASTITTNADQANGGNIEIKAGNLHLNNGSITATVNEEQGMGGNITIDSELIILLEDSEIIAQASEGQGGNIGIVAKGFVADETSLIDASSDQGINGTVNIESIIDLSENVAQLPLGFAEPITLFEEPCAERLRGGQASSFVVSGRAGVPAGPSGGLPSLMVDIPLTRRDADGVASLSRRRETWSSRRWHQTSRVAPCHDQRSGTAVSQHVQ